MLYDLQKARKRKGYFDHFIQTIKTAFYHVTFQSLRGWHMGAMS